MSNSPRHGKYRSGRQLRLEQLEARRVFAGLAFESVSSIGDGTAATSAFGGVQFDDEGNRVVAGYFSGTVDFDPSNSHAGDVDVLSSVGDGENGYVAKYSSNGALSWVRGIGNAGNGSGVNVRSKTVAVDSAGDIYIAGVFSGSVDFGSATFVSTGNDDIFLAKLDSANGNVVWALQRGGSGKDDVDEHGLAAGANDDISIVFGSGGKLEIAQIASDTGVPNWTSAIDSDPLNQVIGANSWGTIAAGHSGEVFIGTQFRTPFDSDPGPGVHWVDHDPNLSVAVIKLSASGVHEWTRYVEIAGNNNLTTLQSMAVDNSGNVLIAGEHWSNFSVGTIDFDNTPGKTASLLETQHWYVAKFAPSGEFLWVNPLVGELTQKPGEGSSSIAMTIRLTTDKSDNLYATGSFYGIIDFDAGGPMASFTSPGPTSSQRSSYLTSLTSEGQFRLGAAFGNADATVSSLGVALDTNNNLALVGSFSGTVDFDPSTEIQSVSSPARSAFILSMPPLPGITVNRPTGNVTSEDETTAEIRISLDAPPIADVTISIAASDPTEGQVSATSLVFTPSNWNVPQLVTITGVDDNDLDDDQQFSINLVTASDDPNHNNLNTAVTVVNLDDDQPQVLFQDSFETGEWNGLWVEDSQNDWFRSLQRSTEGSYSAEVDGSATNATITTASNIDLSDMQSAELTFDWLIEGGFDSGEYLSLDISTNGGSSWTQDVRRLGGNVSQENAWHSQTIDLTPFLSSQLKVRFRARASGSDEDANVDNVRITGVVAGPNTPPVADAGSGYAMNEGSSVILSGLGSNDPDGTIVSYAWDLDSDGQYDDASGPSANFATVVSGAHVVGLQVTDNRGTTATGTTVVSVNNVAPTANAGVDQNVTLGTAVSLSAASSSDPGLDIVDYVWDLDNDGLYNDAIGIAPIFNPPSLGEYTVHVQVTDADGATSVDQMQLVVADVPTETTLFEDSFEISEWNGLWGEDSQNDWFRSTQRATDGVRSAEVDGSANNATLTMASGIDLSGHAAATLTFDWLIESSFDAGEYVSLDISTNGGTTWTPDVRRLIGNVSVEDVWHSESVDLSVYASSNLKIRFRGTVSGSTEDANVDNVKIVANSGYGSLAATLEAGADQYFAELAKKRFFKR